MNPAEEVARILADAEQKVGELVAEALGRKDYVAVQWLTSVAQSLAGVRGGAARVAEPDPTARAAPSLIRAAAPLPPASEKVAGPEGNAFPRFYRDQNQLVKIGYSKSDRRTYEHRSPREVLDRLVTLLVELGGDGKRFTSESLLPPTQARMAGVPTYQIYLCLGFLVRRGRATRRGRSDYTLAGEAADLAATVQSDWESLPTRRPA